MNNTQPQVVESSDRGEDWMSSIVTDQQQGNDTVRVWTDAEWTTEASRGPLTTARCHADGRCVGTQGQLAGNSAAGNQLGESRSDRSSFVMPERESK